MRVIEQPIVKTILFGRAFREDAGQQSKNRVYQHHGGQFAAADDEVSDANFLVDPVLDNSFVHSFVVTAQQDQARHGGQLVDPLLSQRFALRSQVDDVAALGLCLHLAEGGEKGRAGHHHAGATAIRGVIELLVFADSPLAQAVQHQLGRAELLGSAGNAVMKGSERLWKEGEDVNPHRIGGVWRPCVCCRGRSPECIRPRPESGPRRRGKSREPDC